MAILTTVRSRASRLFVTVTGFVAATLLASAPVSAQRVTEQDVKAAFLYNFTRFIEWPGHVPQGSEPFKLCVIADPPITGTIQRTMQGESVKGRPSQTIVPRSPAEARACQILFIGRTDIDRAGPLLDAVRDLPVLTVSDASGFCSRGGAIEFLLEDGRVRFDINNQAAKQVGLAISSRLLQVARQVDGKQQ